MARSPIDMLLDRLCVELGFCLVPEQRERLAAMAPASVHAFTDAVFRRGRN